MDYFAKMYFYGVLVGFAITSANVIATTERIEPLQLLYLAGTLSMSWPIQVGMVFLTEGYKVLVDKDARF